MLSTYASNTGVQRFIKQILLELRKEIDNDTTIAQLTALDRPSRQKIGKESQELSWTLDEMDLTDIYKHSTQQLQNIHYSSPGMEQSPKDHILGN